ncbi:hypothetical protein IGI67_003720 [Enterococcus sp. AZ196]
MQSTISLFVLLVITAFINLSQKYIRVLDNEIKRNRAVNVFRSLTSLLEGYFLIEISLFPNPTSQTAIHPPLTDQNPTD